MDTLDNLILFLPYYATLFWTIMLLCNKKNNLRPQNICILFLLVCNVCSIIWGMLFSGIDDYHLYYKLDILDITFSLECFPFIYFYFWSLASNKKFTWKQYIHLLPGILTGSAIAVLYLLMGDDQSAEYFHKVTNDYPGSRFTPGSLQWIHYIISFYVYNTVLLLQIITVTTYSTKKLIRYKKRLGDLFSSLDEKSLENNRAVLTGLYICIGVTLAAVASWSFAYEFYYSYFIYIIMATFGIVFYYISYHIYKLRFIVEETISEPEISNEIELTDPVALDQVCIKILPQLVKLIEEEKVFLQPNLSLDDIAQNLNTNRTYISRVINEEFKCNFYEFINNERIKYAKTLVSQNPLFTQEQVAEMSGFTYAPTFSRVFKKHTGTTFRQWQKSIK